MSAYADRTDGQEDPFLSYRFRVRFAGDGMSVEAAFARCSGVQVKKDAIKVRSGADASGVYHAIPLGTSYGRLILSKGVVSDNRFLDWVLDTINDESNGTIERGAKSLEIAVIDASGQEGIVWQLDQVVPSLYRLGDLDAGGNNVLIETMELNYNGLHRVSKPAKKTEQ